MKSKIHLVLLILIAFTLRRCLPKSHTGCYRVHSNYPLKSNYPHRGYHLVVYSQQYTLHISLHPLLNSLISYSADQGIPLVEYTQQVLLFNFFLAYFTA